MEIDFTKQNGLVPAIVQHAVTRQVLMLGFMNEEAYRITRETGKVTFFSRSRQTLWTKGETSGHFLSVREISIDCDCDTVLVQAEPQGPTCHTGSDTCFGESVREGALFLERLASVIAERRRNPIPDSYTASLFASGIDRIAQKVGEEAVEVVIEAKNEGGDRLIDEASDLLFHLLVLLEFKGVSFDRVIERLSSRHRGHK